MTKSDSQHADLISAAADLLESLDLPHKARVIDPLVGKLKRATRKALKAGSATIKWKAMYDSVIRKAYNAGARQAWSDLGPMTPAAQMNEVAADYLQRGDVALHEARRKYPLPKLPDPKRMAELAALDIDWTDLDFSSDRALMIAEFEVSTAFHDGMKNFAGTWRGGNGPVEKKWIAQEGACEEICIPNMDLGFIDEESPFDSGDFEPPGHPRCRCSLEYRATPK